MVIIFFWRKEVSVLCLLSFIFLKMHGSLRTIVHFLKKKMSMLYPKKKIINAFYFVGAEGKFDPWKLYIALVVKFL